MAVAIQVLITQSSSGGQLFIPMRCPWVLVIIFGVHGRHVGAFKLNPMHRIEKYCGLPSTPLPDFNCPECGHLRAGRIVE